MSKIVLIPQAVDPAGVEYLVSRGYEIRKGTGFTSDILKKEIVDCDAVYARTASYTREVLEAANKLKIISRFGVGYDNIDVDAARELGIWVTITANANAVTVAEHTIGMIIACARNFHRCDTDIRSGGFGLRNSLLGVDLAGKTLGLLGLGRIARDVARKAVLGFDMQVVAYDPFVTGNNLPAGVKLAASREEVFRKADFVSLHMPVTDDTRFGVGKKEFSLMKRGAYLINCGRGDLVQEAELVEALTSGTIAGAGIDVFSPEPPVDDTPLFKLDNVFLTPHTAGITKESFLRMARDSAEAIDDVLSGRKPKYPVVSPSE